MAKEYILLEEASKAYGFSEEVLLKLARRGSFEHYYTGGKIYLSRKDLKKAKSLIDQYKEMNARGDLGPLPFIGDDDDFEPPLL